MYNDNNFNLQEIGSFQKFGKHLFLEFIKTLSWEQLVVFGLLNKACKEACKEIAHERYRRHFPRRYAAKIKELEIKKKEKELQADFVINLGDLKAAIKEQYPYVRRRYGKQDLFAKELIKALYTNINDNDSQGVKTTLLQFMKEAQEKEIEDYLPAIFNVLRRYQDYDGRILTDSAKANKNKEILTILYQSPLLGYKDPQKKFSKFFDLSERVFDVMRKIIFHQALTAKDIKVVGKKYLSWMCLMAIENKNLNALKALLEGEKREIINTTLNTPVTENTLNSTNIRKKFIGSKSGVHKMLPLVIALENHHYEMVKYLAQFDINIFISTDYYQSMAGYESILQCMIKLDDYKMIDCFFKKYNGKNDFFKSSLEYAIDVGAINISKKILEKISLTKEESNSLFNKIMEKLEQLNIQLREKPQDIALKDLMQKISSIAHFLIEKGLVKELKFEFKMDWLRIEEIEPLLLLILKKTIHQFTQETKDQYLFYLLSGIHANLPRIELAQYLIDHGANVNVQDQEGRTLLHLAILNWDGFNKKNNGEIIKFLLEQKSNTIANEDNNGAKLIETFIDSFKESLRKEVIRLAPCFNIYWDEKTSMQEIFNKTIRPDTEHNSGMIEFLDIYSKMQRKLGKKENDINTLATTLVNEVFEQLSLDKKDYHYGKFCTVFHMGDSQLQESVSLQNDNHANQLCSPFTNVMKRRSENEIEQMPPEKHSRREPTP